jgi:hypothetical protein
MVDSRTTRRNPMSESELSPEELADFHEKLNQFKTTLTADQLNLLEAILRLAWNATEHEESLEAGFAGCFSLHQTTTLMSYHPAIAAGSAVALPRIIRHTSIP